MNYIKVILADDHSIIREGIISLFSNEPQIYIVGTAANGKELVDLYFDKQPDVLLTDYSMPIMNGLDALVEIKKKDKNAKALFLSMFTGDEYVYSIVKAGGMGLISKDSIHGEIVLAIKQIFSGKPYFNGKYAGKSCEEILEIFKPKNNSKSQIDLSDKEKSILISISKGNSSKEIDEEIKMSKKTIDFYRTNILKKLNLKSPNELFFYAQEYIQNN